MNFHRPKFVQASILLFACILTTTTTTTKAFSTTLSSPSTLRAFSSIQTTTSPILSTTFPSAKLAVASSSSIVIRYAALLESEIEEEAGDVTNKNNNEISKLEQTWNQNENTESSSLSPLKDWSFVDKVYLITCPNADPDSERLNKAKGILGNVGLLDKVVVKEFDTDDEDRIRGCYTSHISVLRDAVDDIRREKKKAERGGDDSGQSPTEWLTSFFSMLGDDKGSREKGEGKTVHRGNVDNSSSSSSQPTGNVLVLEDNIEVTGTLESIPSIADFVRNENSNDNDDSASSVDMIHLSYIPYVPNLIVSKTNVNKNIVKLSSGIGSALGTTAYIINENAMQALLEEDAKTGYYAAIPDVMADLFPESRYAAYPTPFLRAPKTKSLVNPQLDDLRELLFQPPIVSQAQNVLALTGLSSNTLFFLTIGGLVVAGGLAFQSVADAASQVWNNGSYDGNLMFPLLNLVFCVASLGIIAQGALLAPKPPSKDDAEAIVSD